MGEQRTLSTTQNQVNKFKLSKPCLPKQKCARGDLQIRSVHDVILIYHMVYLQCQKKNAELSNNSNTNEEIWQEIE